MPHKTLRRCVDCGKPLSRYHGKPRDRCRECTAKHNDVHHKKIMEEKNNCEV